MAKRWVIKLGSGLLTRKDGKVDRVQIGRIADQLAALRRKGYEVVLVSSGAVASGMTAMGLDRRPKDARELQACATVGQPELMSEYGRRLRRHGLLAAQMLLTYWDLDSRGCTRNARATLDLLLRRGRFIPIINENDAIADEEIKVGDNDRLSAHVAALIEADLLVILSGVDGLMTRPDGTGSLVPKVTRLDAGVRALAGGAGSERNVGGMVTKLQAAEIAAEGGVDTVIANGRRPGVLLELSAGRRVGTRFSLRRR
ncbi:MAG: glutamate 5-kinase [Opitutales bacterium]